MSKIDVTEMTKEQLLSVCVGLGIRARPRAIIELFDSVFDVQLDKARFNELARELVDEGRLQVTDYGVYRPVNVKEKS